MKELSKIYLHLSNSGTTFKVVDNGHGPELRIESSTFGNMNSEQSWKLGKKELVALKVMLEEAISDLKKDGSSKGYVHQMKYDAGSKSNDYSVNKRMQELGYEADQHPKSFIKMATPRYQGNSFNSSEPIEITEEIKDRIRDIHDDVKSSSVDINVNSQSSQRNDPNYKAQGSGLSKEEYQKSLEKEVNDAFKEGRYADLDSIKSPEKKKKDLRERMKKTQDKAQDQFSKIDRSKLEIDEDDFREKPPTSTGYTLWADPDGTLRLKDPLSYNGSDSKLFTSTNTFSDSTSTSKFYKDN